MCFQLWEISFLYCKKQLLKEKICISTGGNNVSITRNYKFYKEHNIHPLILNIILLLRKIAFRDKNMYFRLREIYLHHWEKNIFRQNYLLHQWEICFSLLREMVFTSVFICVSISGKYIREIYFQYWEIQVLQSKIYFGQ